MKEIDKTRDNIRVQNLEDDARKELFKRFTDAGGKVVKERRPIPIVFDRKKQKEMLEKIDSHRASRPKKEVKKDSYSYSSSSANVSLSNSFADKLATRFVLFFSGVTTFSGKKIKPGFIEKFSDEYKSALIELQMIYLDIFRQNPVVGERIIFQLDNLKPLYFELVEMTADLFDRTLIGEITDQYNAFPDEPLNTNDFKVPLLAYFKKIYPLVSYENSIYIAYEKAISLQAKMVKDKASVYSAKRKKANNSIYVVFNKLLPKLYRLFCYYHGANVPLDAQSKIEEILLIGPDLCPGMRTNNSVSRFSENFTEISANKKAKIEEEKKDAIEELKKKHKAEISEEVKRGLLAMKKLSFDGLKQTYFQNSAICRNVPVDDFVMKPYLLFVEFDRQYSLVLTSNKIKYNIYYDRSGKKDYKIEISNSKID